MFTSEMMGLGWGLNRFTLVRLTVGKDNLALLEETFISEFA